MIGVRRVPKNELEEERERQVNEVCNAAIVAIFNQRLPPPAAAILVLDKWWLKEEKRE